MRYSLNDLKKMAEDYSKQANIGDVFCLNGDLGTGKTTFAQFFIHARYPELVVTSPTFTIYNIYHEIVHYDLYRILDESELFHIDLLDYFQTKICLIEWPERLGSLYPNKTIEINF